MEETTFSQDAPSEPALQAAAPLTPSAPPEPSSPETPASQAPKPDADLASPEPPPPPVTQEATSASPFSTLTSFWGAASPPQPSAAPVESVKTSASSATDPGRREATSPEAENVSAEPRQGESDTSPLQGEVGEDYIYYGEDIEDHMILAILSTILFPPVGLFAVGFANMVRSAKAQRDYELADSHSANAQCLGMTGIFFFLLFTMVYLGVEMYHVS